MMTAAWRLTLAAGVAALICLTPAGEPPQARDFATWMGELRREAINSGVSQATVDKALHSGVRPIARIIELDRKQPEKTRTLAQYLDSVISADRKEKGRTRYLNNKTVLNQIGDKYGVDPAMVVALWGVETSYGAITGGYNFVDALATLAYDGRRSDYFRGELIKALKIVDQGHIPLERFKGSWAGAMGQCQFMPSSFMNFAVDHNGDGRRDIWTTEQDVFASAANYLSKSGWKRGQGWGHEVTLPAGFNRALLGTEKEKERPLSFWRQQNVRGLNGAQVADDASLMASVIQPDGVGGRAFIVYENYKVILKWNRSNYFATSVGLLSDHIRTGKSAKPHAAKGATKPVVKPAAPAVIHTAPDGYNN